MKESRDIKLSKTLSYLLRHGAVKEKLPVNPDGYIPLAAILNHNRFKSQKYNIQDIIRITENNDKKRFTMRNFKSGLEIPPSALPISLTDPLIIDDWKIRANQGHSLKLIDDSALQLKPLKEITDFPSSTIIHGTFVNKLKLIIKSGGLSKMNRNHIHFASGLLSDPNVISGMRKNCNVFIYLNISKALSNGLEFYLSENGVILTRGDENGFVKIDLFEKIVNKDGNSINIDTLIL